MYNPTHFDNWAKQYEATILSKKDQYPFAGYFEILDFLKNEMLKDSKSILDLGTGSGYMLSKVLEGNNADYFGLDFSEKMLQIAQSKFEPSRFLQWDLSKEAVPEVFENRKFDLILSAYTLHHFELKKKLEILLLYKNLLSEKGKIVIPDISFETIEERNKVKEEVGKGWDREEEEGYFIAKEFCEEAEKKGFKIAYNKISFCSAIYVLN